MKLSEFVFIDDEHDEIRIAGARVSGEVFRTLAKPSDPGHWYRTVKVDHKIVVETKKEAP